MRHKGKITEWKDQQGFGFIQPSMGAAKVFVHIKSFNNKNRRPKENEIITYSLVKDTSGKTHAEAVLFSGEKLTKSKTKQIRVWPYILIAAFFALLGLLCLSAALPVTVLWLYTILSVISFFAYIIDKSSAEKNRWRTKERTLQILALFGGWPGALLAQRIIRHKSSKKPFLVLFWLSVVVNCILLAWFYVVFSSNGLPNYLT